MPYSNALSELLFAVKSLKFYLLQNIQAKYEFLPFLPPAANNVVNKFNIKFPSILMNFSISNNSQLSLSMNNIQMNIIFYQYYLINYDIMISKFILAFNYFQNIKKEVTNIVEISDILCAGKLYDFFLNHVTVDVTLSDTSLLVSKKTIIPLAKLLNILNLFKKNIDTPENGFRFNLDENKSFDRMISVETDFNDFYKFKQVHNSSYDTETKLIPDPQEILLSVISPSNVVFLKHVHNEKYHESVSYSEIIRHQSIKKSLISKEYSKLWCTLTWHYHEPRKIISCELENCLKIANMDLNEVLDNNSLKCRQIKCQLCYWDEIYRVFVVAAFFYLPFKNVEFHSEKNSLDPIIFPALDLSIQNDNHMLNKKSTNKLALEFKAGKANHDYNSPQYKQSKKNISKYNVHINPEAIDRSKIWMLRWQASENLCNPKHRLAISMAIFSNLKISSVCPRSLDYKVAMNVNLHRLHINLFNYITSKNVETFSLKTEKLALVLQNNFELGKLRLLTTLDNLKIFVQDFGHYVRIPFFYNTLSYMTLCKTVDKLNRKHYQIKFDLAHLTFNICSKTLIPVYYAINILYSDFLELEKKLKINNLKNKKNNNLKNTQDHGNKYTDDKLKMSMQYRIINCTSELLWYGQYGTIEAETIPPGSIKIYNWRMSSTYLKLTKSDKSFLEKLSLPVEINGDIEKRTKYCASFKPLMHFARHNLNGEHGLWSKPIYIDKKGIYKRQIIHLACNENNKHSDFFVNDLWINVQHEENGFQKTVSIMSSHVIINHIPFEIELRAAKNVHTVDSYNPQLLKDIMEDTFSSSRSSNAVTKKHFFEIKKKKNSCTESFKNIEDLPYNSEFVGFIEKSNFDYQYNYMHALGLFCPNKMMADDTRINNSLDILVENENKQKMNLNVKNKSKTNELQIELRYPLAKKWSMPILLDKKLLNGSQLIEIPNSFDNDKSMWLWIHLRQAQIIRTDHEEQYNGWYILELWPSAYFYNASSFSLICRAYSIHENEIEKQNPHDIPNNEEHFDNDYKKEFKESLEKKNSTVISSNQSEEFSFGISQNQTVHTSSVLSSNFLKKESAEFARIVGPNDINALFINPNFSQLIKISHADIDNQVWSKPPLHISKKHFYDISERCGMYSLLQSKENFDFTNPLQPQFYVNSAFLNKRCETLLAHKLISLDSIDADDRLKRSYRFSLEGHKLSQFASLVIKVQSPLSIFNESDRTLYVKSILACDDANDFFIAPVEANKRLDIAYPRNMLLGLQFSINNSKGNDLNQWSSIISLEKENIYFISVPIENDYNQDMNWIVQFHCEVVFEKKNSLYTFLRLKNRVVLHNMTQYDLILETPPIFINKRHIQMLPVPCVFRKKSTLTPLSFLLKNRTFKSVQKYSESKQSFKENKTKVIPNISDEEPKSSTSTPFLGSSRHQSIPEASILKKNIIYDSKLVFHFLITQFRLRLEENKLSQTINVSSLNLKAESYVEYFLLETNSKEYRSFCCRTSDVNGILHSVIYEIEQPDVIVNNTLSVGVLFPRTKSKELNKNSYDLDYKENDYTVYIPPNNTVEIDWHLLERKIEIPFEILRENVTNEDNRSKTLSQSSFFPSSTVHTMSELSLYVPLGEEEIKDYLSNIFDELIQSDLPFPSSRSIFPIINTEEYDSKKNIFETETLSIGILNSDDNQNDVDFIGPVKYRRQLKTFVLNNSQQIKIDETENISVFMSLVSNCWNLMFLHDIDCHSNNNSKKIIPNSNPLFYFKFCNIHFRSTFKDI